MLARFKLDEKSQFNYVLSGMALIKFFEIHVQEYRTLSNYTHLDNFIASHI